MQIGDSIIVLRLRDTSAGAGTYSLDCYVKYGGVISTYSFDNVVYSLTPGDLIPVGVIDTDGGKWSCLYISTN